MAERRLEWTRINGTKFWMCPRCSGISRYKVRPEICSKCGWQAPMPPERTRPMTKCKLCGGDIKDGQMVFALVVAIEGEKVKAKWCFCTDCVLQKIGKAVEQAGVKILPELVAKFLAG